MKKPTKIIISIIVAAGLFYGGYAYGAGGHSQSASSAGAYAGRTGRTASSTGAFAGAFGGAAAGGSATTGTIVSSTPTSITVALKSGSVVVFYSTSTPIMWTTTGTAKDITAGANITVIGTANSDGSVTASSIQLRQTP